MHHYPRNPGDYRRDTPHLTLVQHGAYGLLLDFYYSSEKALPDDMNLLCRICGATKAEERKAVDVVIKSFFTLADGAHHHRRCDAEIAKFHGNSKGGKEGMKKRWNDKSSNNSSDNSPCKSTGKSPDNNQNQNQNQNQLERESHTRPTLAQAMSGAAICGVTEQEAGDWWNAREASEWMKGTGGGGTTPVGRNWQADLKTFTNAMREQRAREEKRGAPAGTSSAPAQPKAESPWHLKQRLEAIETELGKLDEKALYDGWNDTRKAKRQELREARAEINRKLTGIDS
jgi:uncharacterized protein YdaU (DUF1376 family)